MQRKIKGKGKKAPAVVGTADADLRETSRQAQLQQKARIEADLPALRLTQERAVSGGGTVAGMQVPAGSYHYWGQRLGYGCWQDKQFQHEFKRDVPESRIRNSGRNPRSSLCLVNLDRVDALFGPDGRMKRRTA